MAASASRTRRLTPGLILIAVGVLALIAGVVCAGAAFPVNLEGGPVPPRELALDRAADVLLGLGALALVAGMATLVVAIARGWWQKRRRG
jgi:hypothetical protein